MENSLGEWLRQRCKQEGLSLRQAARKSSLSHSTIAQIIDGSSASLDTIKKLAHAFGGNGRQGLVLEDKLLILAGYRTQRPGEELSEPLAQVLDKISSFSEPQLKIMLRFADFLSEMETH